MLYMLLQQNKFRYKIKCFNFSNFIFKNQLNIPIRKQTQNEYLIPGTTELNKWHFIVSSLYRDEFIR